MSNLSLRVLTAAAGIPLLLIVDRAGGPVFAAVVGVAAVIGTLEALRLVRASGYRPCAIVGVPIAAALAALPEVVHRPEPAWIALLLALCVLSGAFYLLPAVYGRNMAGWGMTVIAVLYVGLCLGHLDLLRESARGDRWVLLVLVITWSYDTGAYLTGRGMGRTRFMSHVSPKKTREGVVGGVLLAAVVALVALPLLGINPLQALVLGMVGAVAAQLGDLLESMLKRESQLKDSGTLIPGHGGLLDRIDSLLLVTLVVYYGARIFGYAS